MTLYALIPAAGAGTRLRGEIAKQYLPLAGRPMLWHAINSLSAAAISNVFVVLAPGDRQFVQFDWSAFSGRLEPLYCGGETRRDTVYNGMVAATAAVDADDWVLVHDAARPCLPEQDLANLIREVGDDRVGGILALPVAESVKRAGKDEGGTHRIAGSEDRSQLWLAQTPQMFRCGLLVEALKNAKGAVTDEAGAVEQMGLRPRLVTGSRENIKVTFAEDLAIAEAILGEEMRIGQGYDVHALVAGRRLVMGGVEIPHDKGLAGHSDADVLLHAICDALLGAAALGDIGWHFPDTNPQYGDIDSRELLRLTAKKVAAAGYRIVNIDSTIVAQAPRMAPHVAKMIGNIAADLGLKPAAVSVKATTTEKLGYLGREEGIAAQAIVLIE